jgi:hypothetical protein
VCGGERESEKEGET